VSDGRPSGIRFAVDEHVFGRIASISKDLVALVRVVERSSMNLRDLRGSAEIRSMREFSRYAEITRTALGLPQPRVASTAHADASFAPSSSDSGLGGSVSSGLLPAASGVSPVGMDLSAPASKALRGPMRGLDEDPPVRAQIGVGLPAQPRLLGFADFSPGGRMLVAAPVIAPGVEMRSLPGATLSPEPSAARTPPRPLLLPRVARFPTLSDAASAAAQPDRVSLAPIADAPAAIRPVPPASVESLRPAGQEPADASVEQSGVTEIHIDGHLLGRFVTDHLSRAATRPPSGGTGFDPRKSPAWPGSGSGL
jgi:hypothetical protein